MVESFTFTSAGLTDVEAFARYQALYSGGADVRREDGPLVAEVRSWRLDRVLLFDRKMAGVTHARPAPRVREDGFSHFTVQYVRSGRFEGSAAAGFDSAGPGQIVLQDTRRPTLTRSHDLHLMTASVARDLIEAAAGSANGLHGRIIQPEEGGLLGDYLQSLAFRADDLATDTIGAVSRAFVDLLSLAISPTGGGGKVALARMDFMRREVVQRLVEHHLESPELGTPMIVSETGVSRTALYRLMEPHGGVARFIASRRIAKVRALLEQPEPGPTIAELADRFAFSSASRLSRKFSEDFGLTPSAYRRLVNDPDQSIDALRQRWAAWMVEVH